MKWSTIVICELMWRLVDYERTCLNSKSLFYVIRKQLLCWIIAWYFPLRRNWNEWKNRLFTSLITIKDRNEIFKLNSNIFELFLRCLKVNLLWFVNLMINYELFQISRPYHIDWIIVCYNYFFTRNFDLIFSRSATTFVSLIMSTIGWD